MFKLLKSPALLLVIYKLLFLNNFYIYIAISKIRGFYLYIIYIIISNIPIIYIFIGVE